MIGLKINNYEITALLGEGGMGAVYLARHAVIGRCAAIKVLRAPLAENRTLVTRFVNEARAANAIHHPNIIDIIDVGTLPGTEIPYLMMELLEGETLGRRIEQRGRLSAAEAADIAYQTASALGAAHSVGIVHRDLKPDNLFLVPDREAPGRDRVKVLDFGIAKLRWDVSADNANTQNGLLMGTPLYMSPEQCRGLVEEIDPRTDVYALGVILYQMVTGVPPFMAAGVGDIIVAHLSQPPISPRQLNPTIPVELEALILKALAKTREGRIQSMLTMQTALRPVRTPTPVSEALWQPVPTPSAHRGVDMPLPMPGRHVTTFGTAAGEVTPSQPILTATGAAARRKRGVAIALSAVVVAGVVAAMAAFTGGERRQGTPAQSATSLDESPPVEPSVTAAPPPPVPPNHSVMVMLTSRPSGARVIDAESGERLGTTPYQRLQPSSDGIQRWRVEKDGYHSQEIEVPLAVDLERQVTLTVRGAAMEAAAIPSGHKRPAALVTRTPGLARAARATASAGELALPPVTATAKSAVVSPTTPTGEPASARTRPEKW